MKKNKVLTLTCAFLGLFIVFFFFKVLVFGETSEDYNYLKSKASQFQEAISEFGAISSEQAANLWAKGVKERNGALQYAVMDENLKQKFNNELEENRPSWITGGSSPWVVSYCVKLRKADTFTHKAKIIFNLATSGGNLGNFSANLQIVKQGDYWLIQSIEMDEKLRQYLDYPKI